MTERFNPDLVRLQPIVGELGPRQVEPTSTPTPSANLSPAIPPPGSYMITFDGFTASVVRSPDADTDHTAVAAQVNNQQTLSAAISNGDIHKGQTATTSLMLGPLDVGLSDSLKFSYSVINNGHDDRLKVLPALVGACIEVLGSAFSANQKILQAITTILTGGLGIIFADCDGVVAAESLTFSGGQLADMTSVTGEYAATKTIPGTDSDWGCGDNSLYKTYWHIQRVPAPVVSRSGVITGIGVVHPVTNQ
jgi:hypothetical protein